MNPRRAIAPAALAGGLWALGRGGLAWAQEKVPPPLPDMDLTTSLIKMAAGLALVLGVMVTLFWLYRRLAPGLSGGGGGGGLRLVGRLALGPRKGVALVEVGNRVLVLGVGDENISLLSSIDDPDEVARLTEGRHSFAQSLRRAGRAKAGTVPENDR